MSTLAEVLSLITFPLFVWFQFLLPLHRWVCGPVLCPPPWYKSIDYQRKIIDDLHRRVESSHARIDCARIDIAILRDSVQILRRWSTKRKGKK